MYTHADKQKKRKKNEHYFSIFFFKKGIFFRNSKIPKMFLEMLIQNKIFFERKKLTKITKAENMCPWVTWVNAENIQDMMKLNHVVKKIG